MLFDARGRKVTRLGILVSFALGLGFSMTSFWFLVPVAGIFTGLFFDKLWHGITVSFIGVALAWLVNIRGWQDGKLANRVMDVLHLDLEAGIVSGLIVILVGGLLGALGGGIGITIHRLRKQSKPNA